MQSFHEGQASCYFRLWSMDFEMCFCMPIFLGVSEPIVGGGCLKSVTR